MEHITENTFTYNDIAALFDYDPETGDLYSYRLGRNIRRKPNPERYTQVCVQGRQLSAHRVAWLLHHGSWPTKELDHINGNRQDNRLCNLREATHQQNIQNRPTFKNNQLGVRGVVKTPQGRYRAQLWHNGRFILNRSFVTIEEASAAYQALSKEVRGRFHRPD